MCIKMHKEMVKGKKFISPFCGKNCGNNKANLKSYRKQCKIVKKTC